MERIGVSDAQILIGIVGIILLFGFVTVLSMASVITGIPHEVEFGTLNGEPLVWMIETVPEAILAFSLGIIGVLFLFHLANGFAYATGRMVEALLGSQ